jgi:hypothetical protein
MAYAKDGAMELVDARKRCGPRTPQTLESALDEVIVSANALQTMIRRHQRKPRERCYKLTLDEPCNGRVVVANLERRRVLGHGLLQWDDEHLAIAFTILHPICEDVGASLEFPVALLACVGHEDSADCVRIDVNLNGGKAQCREPLAGRVARQLPYVSADGHAMFLSSCVFMCATACRRH